MRKTLFISTVISAFFASGVMAADVQTKAVGVVGKGPFPVPGVYSKTPDLGISKTQKIDDTKLSSRSAAQGIYAFQIGYVGSSNVGWEYVYGSTTYTNNNHGGGALRIIVFQHGYGNVNNATMNGITKSPYETLARCGNNLNACAPGQVITGWRYRFNFDGQQAGTVSVSANSTAYPYGYWSDSIYVQ